MGIVNIRQPNLEVCSWDLGAPNCFLSSLFNEDGLCKCQIANCHSDSHAGQGGAFSSSPSIHPSIQMQIITECTCIRLLQLNKNITKFQKIHPLIGHFVQNISSFQKYGVHKITHLNLNSFQLTTSLTSTTNSLAFVYFVCFTTSIQ